MKQLFFTLLLIILPITGWTKSADSKFSPGDINEDGVLDEKDVQELSDIIMGVSVYNYKFEIADMNNDGYLNAADIVLLYVKIYDDYHGGFDLGVTADQTEMESYVEQLVSDEDEAEANAEETVYTYEEAVKYDAMAENLIRNNVNDDDNGVFFSAVRTRSDDSYAQEAINNNINEIDGIIVEQQTRDAGNWGNSRFGGFQTFYHAFKENGKRQLLVVFYYKGGFPNSKTAYLKLGQLNSGKIINDKGYPIKRGDEYAYIKVCIDDYLGKYGCVNFFPLLKRKGYDGNEARNYLNPIFVKSEYIVPLDWKNFKFDDEFGTINNVSVYCNTGKKANEDPDKERQCVELCVRYIKNLNKGIKRGDKGWGNADVWHERRANDDVDKDRFLVYENGTTKVREGDIITWPICHIAVVIKVKDDEISIAHQNGGTKSTASPIGTRLKLEGNYISDLHPESGSSAIYGSQKKISHIIRMNSKGEHYVYYPSTMTVNTTNIDFGEVEVGKSRTGNIMITNKGTSDLNILSIMTSDKTSYTTNGKPCAIGHGETKTFTVTFAPQKSGDYPASMRILSDAYDNSDWTITLSGKGYGETATTEDDRVLMFSDEVDGKSYKLYKKLIDKNDCHQNYDGWNFYLSQLILETTMGGTTTTTVVDEAIYLSEKFDKGQSACMLFDYPKNRMYIFCNSKDRYHSYTMDGYAYVSPINKANFTRETVFTSKNWGWFPYFSNQGDGSVTLYFFSYAGYYAMKSVRQSNGTWSTSNVGSINPNNFSIRQSENPSILVIR